MVRGLAVQPPLLGAQVLALPPEMRRRGREVGEGEGEERGGKKRWRRGRGEGGVRGEGGRRDGEWEGEEKEE